MGILQLKLDERLQVGEDGLLYGVSVVTFELCRLQRSEPTCCLAAKPILRTIQTFRQMMPERAGSCRTKQMSSPNRWTHCSSNRRAVARERRRWDMVRKPVVFPSDHRVGERHPPYNTSWQLFRSSLLMRLIRAGVKPSFTSESQSRVEDRGFNSAVIRGEEEAGYLP